MGQRCATGVFAPKQAHLRAHFSPLRCRLGPGGRMAVLTLTLVALLACVLAPAAAQVGAYGWAFGGDFLIANTDVGSAALYQNGTYHALGGGIAYTSEGMRTYQDVSVILEYDDGLYVAGRFADHGLRGIGQWDGKKWDNLRGGFTGGSEVTAQATRPEFIILGLARE